MSAFDSLGTIGSGLGALTSIGGGIFSAITGSRDQKDISNIQGQIAGLEEQSNSQRRTAMELSARRQQTQTIRQQQMARSMALTNATSQGAQFGTGLQGGYASIAGQSGVNQLATSQNQQIGENIFNIDNQIDQAKVMLARSQSDAASDQAFGKLFGGIGGSLGDLGKFASVLPGLFAL